MLIRIKKKTDGGAAPSCTRSDGTVTWQQQNGQQGRFFPLHDLRAALPAGDTLELRFAPVEKPAS